MGKLMWILIAILMFTANVMVYANRLNPEICQINIDENQKVEILSEVMIYRNNYFHNIYVLTNVSNQKLKIQIEFLITADYIPEMEPWAYKPHWFDKYMTSYPHAIIEAKYAALGDYFKLNTTINGVPLEKEVIVTTGSNNSPWAGNYDKFVYSDIILYPHKKIYITNCYYQAPDIYDGVLTPFSVIRIPVAVSYRSQLKTMDSKIFEYIPKYFQYGAEIFRHNYDLYTNNTIIKEHEYVSKNFFLNVTNSNYILLQNEHEYLLYFHERKFIRTNDLIIQYGMKIRLASEVQPFYSSSFFNHILSIVSNTNQHNTNTFPFYILSLMSTNTLKKMLVQLSGINIRNYYLSRSESIPLYIQGYLYIVPCRFLINTFYALHGYQFSNPLWFNFYSNFPWYKPITNAPVFDVDEKRIIEQLGIVERSWSDYAP